MRRLQGDGLELAVADEGEGPPVLLIHGFPDSSRVWRHQVRALAGAGFRTIAPDLRGFGDSDRFAVLSVGHPMALRTPTLEQREKGWYQLLFQFEGTAEELLTRDDWRLPREWTLWSDRDHYLSEAQMAGSGECVVGEWRYERFAGASHWMQLDAPERVNALLLEWFGA